MGVVNLPSGRPTMELTGGALERLQAITPPGCAAQIDLTITDEVPTAQAIVIISAVPLTGAGGARREARNLNWPKCLCGTTRVLDCVG